MTPAQAIDEAKAAHPLPQGEPLVGRDEVALRHLWDALERISGMDDVSAMEELSKALRSGQLTPHTLGAKTTIPSTTWPVPQSQREGPFSEDWLTGAIRTNEALPGFKGELPVVDRKEAERWLRKFRPVNKGGRPPKAPNFDEIYRKHYPDGHEAVGHSVKEVARKILPELETPVSLDTIKRRLDKKK